MTATVLAVAVGPLTLVSRDTFRTLQVDTILVAQRGGGADGFGCVPTLTTCRHAVNYVEWG